MGITVNFSHKACQNTNQYSGDHVFGLATRTLQAQIVHLVRVQGFRAPKGILQGCYIMSAVQDVILRRLNPESLLK